MKRTPFAKLAVFAVIVVSLPVAACTYVVRNAGDNDQSSSSSSSSFSSAIATPNVSYKGTLDELGVSTFMQGTHKLTLDDGQMIILQSTDDNLNLDTYIGKTVEVRGSAEPTVEEGGTLLRVTEIVVLGMMSSSESSSEETMMSSSEAMTKKMCGGIAGFACDEGEACIDDPSDDCDPTKGGADCSGICVKTMASSSSTSSSSSVSSSASVVSSSTSSVSSVSSSVQSSSSSSAPSVMSPEMEQQVSAMAKQSYDQESLWSQKYCTSHIGFCIPVHKNWYFKSFGATTSNLWHVEFGLNAIDELGQGAIVLNLVSGTSASMNAVDGQLKTQGNDVIGFKDWGDDRHFELIADSKLSAAVEFMLSKITSYELAQ